MNVQLRNIAATIAIVVGSLPSNAQQETPSFRGTKVGDWTSEVRNLGHGMRTLRAATRVSGTGGEGWLQIDASPDAKSCEEPKIVLQYRSDSLGLPTATKASAVRGEYKTDREAARALVLLAREEQGNPVRSWESSDGHEVEWYGYLIPLMTQGKEITVTIEPAGPSGTGSNARIVMRASLVGFGEVLKQIREQCQAEKTAATGRPNGIDCNSPNLDASDLLICQSHQSKIIDRRLNAAYRALLNRLADDEKAKKSVTEAQRAWIKHRDLDCPAFVQATTASPGGSMYGYAVGECLNAMATTRTKELEMWVTQRDGR